MCVSKPDGREIGTPLDCDIFGKAVFYMVEIKGKDITAFEFSNLSLSVEPSRTLTRDFHLLKSVFILRLCIFTGKKCGCVVCIVVTGVCQQQSELINL